jgi:pimeloyl-ACP methyl ester carboxylesterase
MNPFFFGPRERRLFGLYAPGRTQGLRTRAAVLCHPWGQEYLRAHRSMRHLATLLTRAGVHVLRFDYFGTGDSAGDFADGDLKGWARDIETAIEELEDTAGVTRVGLVGMRLGGTLAAAVATKRRDVESLVLWDPVVQGKEYVDELLRASPLSRSGPADVHEVLGFALTERMSRELESIDLVEQVPSLPARTLVIASEALRSHASLQPALAGRQGQPLPLEFIEAPPAWLEHRSTGIGAIPVNVLQRIVQWWG